MSETETEVQEQEPVTAPEPDADPTPQTEEEEEEEAQEAEQTPEPEPEPEGMSDKEREKQQKAIDAEAKRHTDKLTAILGSDGDDVTQCPFCDPRLQGFFYDAQLATPRDEMQAAMISALREPPQAAYLDAQDVSRCDRCDGYGKTKTGSLVPGNETKVCGHCLGFGFYPPPGNRSNGPLSQDDAHELVLAGNHEPIQDEADPWGSPRLLADGQENPNYGKMPQFKNPTLP